MRLGDLISAPVPAQPILPQASLPVSLQNGGAWLSFRRPLFTPNDYDAQIDKESSYWKWIAMHGGIKSCCRIPELGTPIWSQPPWQVMPSSGLRLNQVYVADTGTVPFDGADHLLGEFVVEEGYDGAVTNFAFGFTGNGFTQGSGNLIWRVKIGQRYAHNLGNVTIAIGDITDQFAIPGSSWRLISGQTVQIFVNIPAGSPINGGQILGATIGWTYPRR